MRIKPSPTRTTLLLLAFVLVNAVHAQQTSGQGTRGRTVGIGTAGTREYPAAGTVGEAIITSDPETRRIIVITDEETSQYVSQVITNLDQPRPQVLINVVFLEVTYAHNFD